MIQVKTVKLRPGARLPIYATPGSAAADLFACLDDTDELDGLPVEDGSLVIPAGARVSIPTGIAIEPALFPPGYDNASCGVTEGGHAENILQSEKTCGDNPDMQCQDRHASPPHPHHGFLPIADNFVALIFGRSGHGAKYGVTLANSVGVVDSDYRGEIKVALINHGSRPFTVSHGDRIAQIAFVPVATAKFVEAETLGETERGTGGFGSTGR